MMEDHKLILDMRLDTIQIYGLVYSLELFAKLALGPIGSTFRIVKREDGIITLQTVET